MSADMEVTVEQFKHLSREDQMAMLFQTLKQRNCETKERIEKCELRFQKLANGKRIDKGIAGTFGIVGGFIAGLFR